MELDFTKLAKQVHEQNKYLGHWDIDRPPAMIRLLILSEVFECFEAWRKNEYVQVTHPGFADGLHRQGEMRDDIFRSWFATFVKHTVQEECADIIIRLLDYIGSADIVKTRAWVLPGDKEPLQMFESLSGLITRIEVIGQYKDVAIRALEYALFLSGYLCGEDIMPYVHLKLRYSRIVGRDPQKKF